MNDNVKNIFVTCGFVVFIFSMMIINILKPVDEISISERRKLKQFPKFSTETLMNGGFAKNFDLYTLDQFVCRDEFRKIKAICLYNIFLQRDNNKIYIADGHASTYYNTLNKLSVEDATIKFNKIKEQFLNDMNVYYSVIPDKNYFLAEDNGYPHIDYMEMITILNEKMNDMEYIDITNELNIDDYYTTDSHWRQEKIGGVVNKLSLAMNFSEYLNDSYKEKKLEPFYGVYCGQSALPLKSEEMIYKTNEVLQNVVVKSLNSDTMKMEDIKVYDEKNFNSNDPYDLFLGGPLAIITIENQFCNRDRELIIFRDSFGSSISPMLVEAYSKITIVDLRYISNTLLKKFITLSNENSDALFLYSTEVLNNSSTLKVL